MIGETCFDCGQERECLATNLGPMCRPCWHSAVKSNSHAGARLSIPPKPGQKTFVVMEGREVYITIGGVLYAFDRRADAEGLAAHLRKAHAPDAEVHEVDASLPMQYVLAHPELSLVGIKELAPGPAASCP